MKTDTPFVRDDSTVATATQFQAAPPASMPSKGGVMLGWLAVSIASLLAMILPTIALLYPTVVVISALSGIGGSMYLSF